MKNPLLSARVRIAVTAAALACAVLPAAAAESATATLAFTQLSSTSWQYDVTLSDTGSTNIGTFWFAWVPGQDYMPTRPTDITSPGGNWAAKVTGGTAGDGFAIQWVAGAGAELAPGQSSSAFTFDSATSPQQMAGDSAFFPGTPVLTSFVYSGRPFSDAGVEFVGSLAAVPEPRSVVMMLAGGLLLGAQARRRRGPSAT